MQETDLRLQVEAYLQAFKEADVAKCVGFFAEDATIDFQIGVFRGKEAIERWHQDRFAAGFSLREVDRITVQGDKILLEAVATSNRLKTWRLNRIKGKAAFQFQDGKIKNVRFSAKVYNPLESW